jgi:UV DNA damage endonuclease
MSIKNIRLGYAGQNVHLRKKHIFASHTCRSETVRTSGLPYVIELVHTNLDAVLKILEWNEAHGIRFFRIGSDFAPHITNPEFVANKKDYRSLAYDPKLFKKQFKAIGDYAKKHGHRLTFHPDPFIVLGTKNDYMLTKSFRELYFHTVVLELMGLDCNSIIVLHGGGMYDNKQHAMLRWIERFNSLPVNIKSRIVLENDEYCYNIEDVLYMSNGVNTFNVPGFGKSKIPVVFDVFHYNCYDKVLSNRGITNYKQKPIKQLIPHIVASWGKRTPKMHISSQKPRAVLGSHSDFIKDPIPKELFAIKNLDLMVEAKAKEKALVKLVKAYKN